MDINEGLRRYIKWTDSVYTGRQYDVPRGQDWSYRGWQMGLTTLIP